MLCSSIFCATSKPPSTSTTLFPGGIIDHPAGKHGPQDAVDMLIQFGPGNLARLHRFLHSVPIEDFSGLRVIQSGGGRFRGLCVPCQSNKTKPWKFQSFFNTSVKRCRFSQAKLPFTRLTVYYVDVDGVPPALLIVLAPHSVLCRQSRVAPALSLITWPTIFPARMGSSPIYSKVRPLRGSRARFTPPPSDML